MEQLFGGLQSQISREMWLRECPGNVERNLQELQARLDRMTPQQRRQHLEAYRQGTETVGDWVRHNIFGESDQAAATRMMNDYRAAQRQTCQRR